MNFHLTPVQVRTLASPTFNQQQSLLVRNEIQELLGKQAISDLMDSHKGFYSCLFLIPKKNGGQWPVANLKVLNTFVKTDI